MLWHTVVTDTFLYYITVIRTCGLTHSITDTSLYHITAIRMCALTHSSDRHISVLHDLHHCYQETLCDRPIYITSLQSGHVVCVTLWRRLSLAGSAPRLIPAYAAQVSCKICKTLSPWTKLNLMLIFVSERVPMNLSNYNVTFHCLYCGVTWLCSVLDAAHNYCTAKVFKV